MWRIKFKYNNGETREITGAGEEITLQQAINYHNTFAFSSDGGTYQRSPYKDNRPEALQDVIIRLQNERLKEQGKK